MFFERTSAWRERNSEERKKVFSFCEEYKDFLTSVKTERESVDFIKKKLEKGGFRDIEKVTDIKDGAGVYKVIKGKSIIAARVRKPVKSARLVASHIDAPRLDLKPMPLYEDSSLAFMRSHYYGGIKKYQWVNTPLSMRAIVHTSKGKKTITYGEREDEPRFLVPDLLIHLARDQMEKKMKEGISGEDLQVLVGNMPVDDEDIKEKVKFTILRVLYEKYGIVEKDLRSADISFVPAARPSDIGFDASMIAAYGHDDRVCAYTSLHALLGTKKPPYTAVGFFADREEIGSYGDTGAHSHILENFMGDILERTGASTRLATVLENSVAMSCDVTDGLNPIFKDVHEPTNANMIGHGISVEKYGGVGGKYSTHEAPAEYMSWITSLLDEHKVRWQTGELGKIDQGGGGTIGMFLAKYGMSVIDAGPPVLAMHSTCEVVSKVDVYEAYRAYDAFLRYLPKGR